ncbi:methyl-accepting chemotaxis protein [Saliterribacillus persicus]|uniref:Methyl-accepting chemotaxis protein n=1 Tax=Saliterribacillus persicus TaxID=930114 RepID=A0A368Y9P4_9BACI|nr:HAMP domain-containing methyl-accepting chemotaxis protein [Saliterribacillus persicus]RCW76991.1 methyl-accepting chemotaxis protein [Saliterribacillus persicus]
MKMNITKKLLLGFISILILLIIIASLTFSSFSHIEEFLSSNEDANVEVELFNEMEKEILNEYKAVTQYLVSSDNSFIDQFEKSNELFTNHAERLLSTDSKNESEIEEVINLEGRLHGLMNEMIMIKDSTSNESYTELINESNTIISSVAEASDELRMGYHTQIEETNGGVLYMSQFSNKVISSISIVAIILGLAIALYISRIISKPLKQLAIAADEVSQGNLLIDEIKVKNRDEIGQLASSFNLMVLNLRDLIANVRDTSEQVAASAEELTASAEQTTSSTNQVTTAIQEVASGSESQGRATQDSANAISDLDKGIKQITDTASTLTESTSATAIQANTGNEMLKKVISQMYSISQSTKDTNELINELDNNSKKIGNIIGAITEIAEQTNLLALNAAIESARAGEHGKGFAVVADEVRKLAEQSRNSASQISNLVELTQNDIFRVVEMTKNSSEQVTEGRILVEDTGKSFGNILGAVDNVSEEISILSSLSKKMSVSMNDVNSSIKEVSSIAKSSISNTADIAASSEEQLATMEEVNMSASNLAKMAEELRNQISTFKIYK